MDVKLTKYAGNGGCACKIGPHILADVLSRVELVTNDRVLADMNGADDGGIYQLSDDTALVQTLDFFTPVVDDPHLFGRIAAANSLSDIYAMGGQPVTTMNIVAFPIPLVRKGVLTEVLNGAMSVVKESGAAAVGGHSIENEVPLFGMSVTGIVHPGHIWTNGGARAGDVLVLTKPIGTGIMTTALKGALFETGTEEAVISMSTLNRLAAAVAKQFTIHACTDVTGFSLMGHAAEMANSSGCSISIDAALLPLFTGVQEAAEMGLVPAATYGNRKALTNVALAEGLSPMWSDICFDPQTSGGLLLAVPADEGSALVTALREAGIHKASCIGSVGPRRDYAVYVK